MEGNCAHESELRRGKGQRWTLGIHGLIGSGRTTKAANGEYGELEESQGKDPEEGRVSRTEEEELEKRS